jgi:hypothetical protein
MGKAYIKAYIKPGQPKTETTAIAIQKKINTINRKQTHMDVWNSATGDSLQLQHRNPPALSVQDSPIHYECTLVHNHRIHEDLQINTVLSEIKKWNTKYLRKLENHTNALAMNLLGNSETTHRLKRYNVLTLLDLSKTPIQEFK